MESNEILLNVSVGPQSVAKDDTKNLMLKVIVALLPTTIWGIYVFGIQAALTILVCIFSCVFFEYIYCKGMKIPVTVTDLSAVVTGLLLALNLTSTIPWWICVIGSFVAIILAKMLFGGIGYNFINPALAARCFLLISFTARMTSFTYDAVTGATPLSVIKTQGINNINILDLFIGNKAGVIGEVSILCILIGALFLIVTKVINIRIPLAYILTFALVMFFIGKQQFDLRYVLIEVLSGGLIFGAFFMATDYTTSPVTPKGEIIFGIILGVLTALFRGPNSEGVSYAIILGNLLVPLIERVTIPNFFGKERKNG